MTWSVWRAHFHAHFESLIIRTKRRKKKEVGLVVSVSVPNLLSKRENGSSIFGLFITSSSL